jgi:hypothetical protein
MFTCHLDTADKKQKKVNHIFEDNIISTDGKSILGADDKAGMTVLLYMISKKVPGLYYFFIGEEVGCIGSGLLFDNWKETEFSNYITKIVSFDRRGTKSVITHQLYGRCCSDDFAQELANRLNIVNKRLSMVTDSTGIMTDSAQFISIVPECTNISVGYYKEHTIGEHQEISFLKNICQAASKIDWETLPVKRDPEEYDEEEEICNQMFGRNLNPFDENDDYEDDPNWLEDNWTWIKDVDGEMEELCASDIVDMDSSYRYSQVTLPILGDGESEFLEIGEYATCVRMWGYKDGDENGTQGMNVGRDLSTKFSGCPQYYEYGDSRWHNLAGSPLFMIGFNIDETGGPTDAAVTFNVDMNAHIASGEFNPGSDFVDIGGSFNDFNGSDPLTDEDGDGIYSLTIEGFNVTDVIEYRYRINGSWDTAEFMEDEFNRSYTIRYWNMVDNVYNGGETVGIEDLTLIESMSVYPNPNSGEFIVVIVNSEVSNMEITLMDIQGHVVYKNTVSGVINHTERISEDLTKGVYFLSINNGKEVKVQKVLVQ